MRSLLLVLVLGCGGDKTGDSSETTPVTSTTTPTTTATTSTTTTTTTTTTTGSLWIDAVPDTWCAPQDRIALIEVSDWGQLTVNAVVMDQIDPWIVAPALSTAECDYHLFTPPSCGGCGPAEICDLTNTCVPQPMKVVDAVLTAKQGTDTEVLMSDPITGDLYANLVMTGAMSFDLEWGTVKVRSPIMQMPAGLTGFSMTNNGVWNAPGDTTLAWDSTTDWAYTRIPINHHVYGPTFTECHVAGNVGTVLVPAPMIDPLAVITGLEFQGMQQAVFASAQTSEGCVEFRFKR